MCIRCQALEAEVERIRFAATVDLQNLQNKLLAEMRKSGALKAELARQNEDSPESQSVKRVCDHWKMRLGHPKAKTPPGGKRWAKVQARLNERYTVEDLLKAVEGCARKPYVGPRGRAADGPSSARHDDLELICRDETTVDRFMGYADEEDPPSTPVRPRPSRPSDESYARLDAEYDPFAGMVRAQRHFEPDPVTKVLDASNRLGLSWRQTGPADWMLQCPVHDDRDPSVHLRWVPADGKLLAHCHAGCETVYVVDAWGLSLVDLFERTGR